MISKKFSRRSMLRGTGVALALPWLEAMTTFASASAPPKRRMVCIMTPLGMHRENFFPAGTGRGYASSLYLRPLEPLREQFTIFSGLSHPGVDGGHESEHSFLTAAPHPAQPGFRNTVSLDQFAAEHLGAETRFASMQLSTNGGSGISWTRSGVQIPSEHSPARLFAKLFISGSPKEVERQRAKLRDGRSIMDTVGAEAKRFERTLGKRDQEKLDEYVTSVREMEQKLVKADAWTQKPKPKVSVKPPQDIADDSDLIGRARLMYDLMHLAIETDSSRLFTLQLQGAGKVAPIPGVSIGLHDLSHHGQDPEKLRQLALVEAAEMQALGEFLTKLHGTKEEGATLLDKTMVFFGSNLGNASSHDTRNMPILLAGGGFKHGQHVSFDANRPPALGNLFVQMLQQLGMEVDAFASGTGGIPGFTA
jgi:hypothetical protein